MTNFKKFVPDYSGGYVIVLKYENVIPLRKLHKKLRNKVLNGENIDLNDFDTAFGYLNYGFEKENYEKEIETTVVKKVIEYFTSDSGNKYYFHPKKKSTYSFEEMIEFAISVIMFMHYKSGEIGKGRKEWAKILLEEIDGYLNKYKVKMSEYGKYVIIGYIMHTFEFHIPHKNRLRNYNLFQFTRDCLRLKTER